MSTATATEQITITLPKDVIDIVRSKVSSGEYTNESEFIEAAVIEASLPASSDAGLEHWIATEGVRRYDAMRADPSRGLTAEQVFSSLDMEPEEPRKAG